MVQPNIIVPFLHLYFFCLGVGATCSQDSGQVLKTRLCGGPGLLNVQIDAAQTLTSVCGESNFQIVHTNMHLIFSFGKWKKKIHLHTA